MAIDGDLLVGAASGWGEQTDGRQGKLIVFHREADPWSPGYLWVYEQELIVLPPDGQPGDWLGGTLEYRECLAMSGRSIAAGAPIARGSDFPFPMEVGYVAMFEWTLADGWINTDVLRSSDFGYAQGAFYGFGTSVAMEGNRLVIGEPRRGDGQVYIVQRDSQGEWQLEQVLEAPTGDPDVGFGWSVDLEGNRLAVGSSGLYQNTGRDEAYLYRFDDLAEEWVLDAVLEPDVDEVGNFGHSIAISGSLILVGDQQYESEKTELASGGVMVFQLNPGTGWSHVLTLVPDDISDNPEQIEFGTAMALYGSDAIIATVRINMEGTNNIGAGYFFRNLPTCNVYESTCP